MRYGFAPDPFPCRTLPPSSALSNEQQVVAEVQLVGAVFQTIGRGGDVWFCLRVTGFIRADWSSYPADMFVPSIWVSPKVLVYGLGEVSRVLADERKAP